MMKIEPDTGRWRFTVQLAGAPDYFQIGYAETYGAAMIEARDAYDALERRRERDAS